MAPAPIDTGKGAGNAVQIEDVAFAGEIKVGSKHNWLPKSRRPIIGQRVPRGASIASRRHSAISVTHRFV